MALPISLADKSYGSEAEIYYLWGSGIGVVVWWNKMRKNNEVKKMWQRKNRIDYFDLLSLPDFIGSIRGKIISFSHLSARGKYLSR